MPGPKDHVPRMGYENLSHHKKRGWLKSQPQMVKKSRNKEKRQKSSDQATAAFAML